MKTRLLVLLNICLVFSMPAYALKVTEISYGPEDAQVLELYTPDNSDVGGLATVVLAHGGLWQSGGRGDLSALCENIVAQSKQNIACASIDYRLSQDLGGSCKGTGNAVYTDQIADLALAFTFLQKSAKIFGLDPNRMFVGGHSAGAHLAQTLNLRWDRFTHQCELAGDCPPPAGAIGLEGIYDISAWDQYDKTFWDGRFACATRKAFGAPGPSPAACLEADSSERCWDIASPVYLAQNAENTGSKPAGDVLLIHSTGDNWVDIAEAINFHAQLTAAFPGIEVVSSTDGSCAKGQHNDMLNENAVADCIIEFVIKGICRSDGDS